jgi:hypothetical protein
MHFSFGKSIINFTDKKIHFKYTFKKKILFRFALEEKNPTNDSKHDFFQARYYLQVPLFMHQNFNNEIFHKTFISVKCFVAFL